MATAAATLETAQDGPVLSMMNKRLRALRKKYNRILQTEESKAQGKPINKEQEDVLRSKPGVVALIEEYEKLRQPLAAAVAEELSLFKSREETMVSVTPEKEPELEAVKELPSSASAWDGRFFEAVEDLLKLLYFGSLFDVRPQSDFTSIMLTKAHERSSCLIYDYVTEDAIDLLVERDLDLLALMESLVISRQPDSIVSHKNALQECFRHAKLWLLNSDDSIHPNAGVSYARLKERLNKILSSDYFTMTPQMTKFSQQTAAEAAAAAAGAVNYDPQVVAEESPACQPQGLQTEIEVNVDQGSLVEESPKVEGENCVDPGENSPDSSPVSQDEPEPVSDSEQNRIDVEYREHSNYPRRHFPNPRGSSRGGRRGYMTGRRGHGNRGRGYQNGRNQYYETGNTYYPRNHDGDPRGRGRGMMYSNNGSYSAVGGRSAQMHGNEVAAEQP